MDNDSDAIDWLQKYVSSKNVFVPKNVLVISVPLFQVHKKVFNHYFLHTFKVVNSNIFKVLQL